MTEQQTKNQNSKFKIQNYLLPLPQNNIEYEKE